MRSIHTLRPAWTVCLLLGAASAQQDATGAENVAIPANDAIFYKAYYQEYALRNEPLAIKLYQKFIMAATESPLAMVAVVHEHDLLQKGGLVNEALELVKKYPQYFPEVVAKAEASGRALGKSNPTTLEKIKAYEQMLVKAKEGGNKVQIAQVEQAIAELKASLATKNAPWNEPIEPVVFDKMSAAEVDKWMAAINEEMNKLLATGQKKKAQVIEGAIQDIKAALAAKNFVKAQAFWDEAKKTLAAM